MASFEDVIENINNLKNLFDSIEDGDKKTVLNRMFMKNIEGFVNKMEEVYYKKIIRNKSITRLKTYQEIEIERTHKTMHQFLPFIVAYNLGQSNDDSIVS